MSLFQSKITVVNHHKHTKTPLDYIIHRGSQQGLGNPFHMEDYANDREVVVNLFLRYFLETLPRIKSGLRYILENDEHFNLVCYCAPLACHGDIYKEFIDFYRNSPPRTDVVSAYRALKNYRSPPLFEGIDHINIYSGSKTTLGKMLSNFYHSPFELKDHGKFESIEGYWYWLSTGMKHGDLRSLFGYEAKKVGRRYERIYCDYFDETIDIAIRAKIDQNPAIKEELSKCNLPFAHYYGYGNPENALIIRSSYRFLETIHRIRSELNGGLPTVVAGSRSIKDPRIVEQAIIDSGFKISDIVSGLAKGVDILGWNWAKMHNIPTQDFKVTKEEWAASLAAGHIRNGKMEKVSKQGILLIQGNSSGSEGMLSLLKKANKPVHVVRIP